MKSETINQWLTLLANVGVIAGIVFLAVELRQNSDITRAQTRAQLAEGVTELYLVNMNDHDYADVLVRGKAGRNYQDGTALMFRRSILY